MTKRKQKKNYLTPTEFQTFLRAAKLTEYPERDQLIALLMYRHGLRVSELLKIKLSDLDLNDNTLHIQRSKGEDNAAHPLQADTIKALNSYMKARNGMKKKPHNISWLILSEQGTSFTRQGINYLVGMIGKKALLPHVHPHMFRHSCGYVLANKGLDTRLIQEYLGHKDIKSTVRYTTVNAERFRKIWDS